MKKHILLVEDDTHIRMGVADALTSEGYEVSETSDGSEVAALVRARNPDLIVLDIMLPRRNGFDICRDLRSAGHTTPVLMLSAKGQEVDKVVGLELGADDYVSKPFSIRELLARIRALLRRSARTSKPAGLDIPAEIRFGNVTIRSATMRGTRGKERFDLSAREMKVLALLYTHSGEVIDRNRFLDEVWGMDYYGTTRTLDQVIVKLRQKVEKDPANPEFLKTVHGVGYRLEK
jgi:DNA-binding response OmpR family regulator